MEGRDASDRLAVWLPQLTEFPVLEPALGALREFGGLVVRSAGAGVDPARDGLAFDPTALVGESDRFTGFACAGVGPLFPLGETADGHGMVLMDGAGRVFGAAVDGVIRRLGDSIEEALDRLVTGRRWIDIPMEPGTRFD